MSTDLFLPQTFILSWQKYLQNCGQKHKYDVGLIKGCEPVVITPKSDYRPCQSQYPLKKEALRGIQPVFESLLKERVIFPVMILQCELLFSP